MEVAGRRESEAGSQSFYELTCEPCNREEGKHLKAIAYCLGCEEYFCKACVKFHKRFGHKDHVLLEGAKMPKAKPTKPKQKVVNKQEEVIDMCEKHIGKLITHYCPDHKIIGCIDCITFGHLRCTGAKLVSDISCQNEAKQLCDSFKIKLQEFAATIDVFLQESTKNKEEADNQYQVARSNLRKYRSEIIEALDSLEKVIEEEAYMQKVEDIQNMDEIAICCKTLKKNISDVEAKLGKLHNENKKSKLFTQVHLAMSQLKDWEKQSEDLKRKNKIQNYTFEPECLIRDMLQNPAGLGVLIRKQETHNKSRDASARNKATKQNKEQSCSRCKRCESTIVALACGHVICTNCAREQVIKELPCSDCGVITGGQPIGSVDISEYRNKYIKMTFVFPGGIQQQHHQNPGLLYQGQTFVCYLWNNDEGKQMSRRLRNAFERGLVGRVQNEMVCDNVGLNLRDPWFLEITWEEYNSNWIPRISNRLNYLGIFA